MQLSSVPIRSRLKQALLSTPAGRVALVGPRALMALKASRVAPRLGSVLAWSVRSRETVNFTYETTRESNMLLAGTVAELTGRPMQEMVGYLDELASDKTLAQYVSRAAEAPESRWNVDPGFHPGRRLAFYLIARSLKPSCVVEAGVDKGLGAVLLSRALRRNASEGRAGDYLGIDINREKRIGLYEGYEGKVGRILRGDAIELMRAAQDSVDLFIHDTTPEPGHLIAMLEAVRPRMSRNGVIASTWTTAALIDYAVANGLKLLTHQEDTVHHWFHGDRMAFLYGFAGKS